MRLSEETEPHSGQQMIGSTVLVLKDLKPRGF